jgi:hypothetical protein
MYPIGMRQLTLGDRICLETFPPLDVFPVWTGWYGVDWICLETLLLLCIIRVRNWKTLLDWICLETFLLSVFPAVWTIGSDMLKNFLFLIFQRS